VGGRLTGRNWSSTGGERNHCKAW